MRLFSHRAPFNFLCYRMNVKIAKSPPCHIFRYYKTVLSFHSNICLILDFLNIYPPIIFFFTILILQMEEMMITLLGNLPNLVKSSRSFNQPGDICSIMLPILRCYYVTVNERFCFLVLKNTSSGIC